MIHSTSERINPEKWSNNITQYLLFLRHYAVYNFIANYVKSNFISLDFGCGDGYGANYLADYVKEMHCVDINPDVVKLAKSKYTKANLFFNEMIDDKLCFGSNFFDAVLSCQVIEHLEKPDNYLFEVKRIVKEGGYFFVSTPNKLTRLNKKMKPWNKFHVKEYSPNELKDYLLKTFSRVNIYGVFGNEEIMNIEKRRVNKRKKIQKFDIFNIRGMIPISIEYKILNFFQGISFGSSKKFPEKIKNYSVNNFVVSQENVENSMDLVAVCKK